MTLDDPAYPFLAFSGIPSISFHFISPDVSLNTTYTVYIYWFLCKIFFLIKLFKWNITDIFFFFCSFILSASCVLCVFTQAVSYPYYGTSLDNMDHLNYQTNHRTAEMMVLAAKFAGQMALRLVHNHLLGLDVSRYSSVITQSVVRVYKRVRQLSQVGPPPPISLT